MLAAAVVPGKIRHPFTGARALNLAENMTLRGTVCRKLGWVLPAAPRASAHKFLFN